MWQWSLQPLPLVGGCDHRGTRRSVPVSEAKPRNADMAHTELAAARSIQPRGVTSRKNHRV